MPLQLTVDGERWRAHLRRIGDGLPGLVPVAKGNGYGFGLGLPAYREAAANLMTDPRLDPFGKIPEFKYCAARVQAVT